jgi:hypothetical protein
VYKRQIVYIEERESLDGSGCRAAEFGAGARKELENVGFSM